MNKTKNARVSSGVISLILGVLYTIIIAVVAFNLIDMAIGVAIIVFSIILLANKGVIAMAILLMICHVVIAVFQFIGGGYFWGVIYLAAGIEMIVVMATRSKNPENKSNEAYPPQFNNPYNNPNQYGNPYNNPQNNQYGDPNQYNNPQNNPYGNPGYNMPNAPQPPADPFGSSGKPVNAERIATLDKLKDEGKISDDEYKELLQKELDN